MIWIVCVNVRNCIQYQQSVHHHRHLKCCICTRSRRRYCSNTAALYECALKHVCVSASLCTCYCMSLGKMLQCCGIVCSAVDACGKATTLMQAGWLTGVICSFYFCQLFFSSQAFFVWITKKQNLAYHIVLVRTQYVFG